MVSIWQRLAASTSTCLQQQRKKVGVNTDNDDTQKEHQSNETDITGIHYKLQKSVNDCKYLSMNGVGVKLSWDSSSCTPHVHL